MQKGCVNLLQVYVLSKLMNDLITDGTDKQEINIQDNYPNEVVAMATALKY